MLETAEKWERVGVAGGIQHREWRNTAVIRQAAVNCNGGGRSRLMVSARGDCEKRPCEPQGFPPATPSPAPSGAVSTRPTTARFFASITIRRPGAAVSPDIGIAMLIPPEFMT